MEEDSVISYVAVIGLCLGLLVIVGVKNVINVVWDGIILMLDV